MTEKMKVGDRWTHDALLGTIKKESGFPWKKDLKSAALKKAKREDTAAMRDKAKRLKVAQSNPNWAKTQPF